MKKLLALVLALVMTMGLATVATNAAYPDENDIDLNEAVEVMTAVGVFKGDEKGNFAPKANLDRAAAAKLIAYLDLGEKAAEALPAVKAFNDVPATHWASKYIAYCANAGYITGAGDGNFYPGNALTGYAFGKMVLCVLGYDATIEGFTGSTWAINVAKLLDKNDITDGVDGAASATLTREQAAQYCLNALKADTVEYESKGTSIEISGATIAVGAKKAEAVLTDNTSWAQAIKTEKVGTVTKNTVQLGEKLFDGDLKLLANSKSDDFHAPATKWKYKTEDVGTYADEPDATYNGKVTMGTMYTLLGKDIYDDLAHKDTATTPAYDRASLTAYVDGVVNAAYAQETQIDKNNSAAAFGTGKGTVTEVYIDDDGQTRTDGNYAKVTVVVKNTYVMKATADYNTKTEKLSVSNKNGHTVSLTSDDFDLDGYKKDDYILYTYANSKVQTIEKAQVVSGKVQSFKGTDNVNIDGTTYDYDVNFQVYDAAKGAFTIGDTATVILDTQGNIIAIDEAKASSDDVVFVLAAKHDWDYEAQIVTVEGKKLTVKIDDDSKAPDGTAIDKTATTLAKFTNTWMAYEIQDDGSYELSKYDPDGNGTNNSLTVSKGTTDSKVSLNKVITLNGKTANANTVYIIKDDDGDIDLYTGVKNAPTKVTISSDDAGAFVAYNKDDEATYVYADAKGGVEDASSETDKLVYILKGYGGTITDSNKKKYVEVEALVDGEKQTLQVAEAAKGDFDPYVDATDRGDTGMLYKSIKTNSNGYVSGTSALGSKFESFSVTTLTNGDDVFKYKNGVATISGITGGSRSVKTDKVYLVLGKGAGDIMTNKSADYEIVEISTFDELASFVDSYKITCKGYVQYNENASDTKGEIVSAYITITGSQEK